MKRVRYAIGVLGMGPALAVPFTHGAATAAHVSGNSAKRVTLTAEQHVAAPAVTCYHQADHSARTDTRFASEYVDWDGAGCIFGVRGTYDSNAAVWAMRIRAYSHPGGNRVYSNVDATVTGGDGVAESWVRFVSREAGQVCVAIVARSDHNDIAFSGGPMCVNT
jgi:hypothetical protein